MSREIWEQQEATTNLYILDLESIAERINQRN
jgi:hypothetical protein